MVTNPISDDYTVEEYLAQEEQDHIRYEYVDGEIFAMSGGTGNHSRITMNTATEINTQLRNTNCYVNSSDLRVKISETKYVYPDFSIVCGESEFADDNHTMLTNPILVAEVLSPSTEGYDRGLKYEFYRSLSSLKAYLLIDQSRIHVELYTLQENGWLFQEFKSLDDKIQLVMIDSTLPLSEIYRGINFDLGD